MATGYFQNPFVNAPKTGAAFKNPFVNTPKPAAPTIAAPAAPAAPAQPKAISPAVTPATALQMAQATLGGYARRQAAAAPAAPVAAATSPAVNMGGWTAPASGSAGPGGAKFGMGSGGPNRFDHTQYGGGLWSIGIDPKAPDVDAQVQRWFGSQPAAVQADVKRGLAGGRSLTWAADWRARDVARKIKIDNSFMNSTFGKILGTVAPIALGFIPGIGTAAQIGLGAAMGGAQGGLKGALLGAAGSAIGPSIRLPGGISAAVRAPVAAIKSVASQVANPAAAARLVASKGLGAAVPTRRA